MTETPKKEISRLTEARNEADTILSAVERAPKSPSWQQLKDGEQSAIAEARDRLIVVKQGEDMAAIRDAMHALDQATQRFAELMIQAVVQTAIRSRN